MARRVFGAGFKSRRVSKKNDGITMQKLRAIMTAQALCPQTADSETFVDLHLAHGGIRARPRHSLVTAFRYEKVARSFRSKHPWIERAKLTLLLQADGHIYYQVNFLYTKKYNGRETRNPWKHLKTLEEMSVHHVALLANEWAGQGYMVTIVAAKKLKAEMAVMALADYGKGH